MMRMVRGLFDHMVLQRTRQDVCHVRFQGECSAAGAVRVTVWKGRQALRGLRNRTVGRGDGCHFSGVLRGIPTGGPYTVEVTIDAGKGGQGACLRVADVLVGDVWILGGQSNMEGIGLLQHALPARSTVRAFYMDDRWGPARDPIHNLNASIDAVHADLSGGVRPERGRYVGVGPGVAFGQEMQKRTGVPQGLIACAHGGSSMDQWNPALKKLAGKSLYGASVRRFEKNGGRVAGVVWYQGCSDAAPDPKWVYTAKMKKLVAAMRRDFRDPRLPVVAVQIATVFGPAWAGAAPGWNLLREQQRLLPKAIPGLAVVPAVDLSLDDLIHISGKDQHRLGRRLAGAMLSLTNGRSGGAPEIAFGDARVELNRQNACADVIIRFDHVVGSLRAAGRPWGFDLVEKSPVPCIYRTDVRGNTVTLKTMMSVADVKEMDLYYGYGCTPYCNITDAADRSLPVFGPVHFGKKRAMTEMAQCLRVSRYLPSAGKLHGLAYPKNPAALKLGSRMATGSPAGMFDLHLDMGPFAPKDVLVYFACRIRCATPMKLAVGLGYDGPVKVWIDKRMAFHNPNGTNPALRDQAVIPFAARAGEHEILVALSSNHGKAWGIMLRFQRRDVTQAMINRGLAPEELPAVLG